MQNQEKIIQAIAEYLERQIYFGYRIERKDADRLATDILATIAPHLEVGAGWEDAPEWANYKTKDPDGSVFFWELEPQKKEDFWSQNANGGRFIVIGVDSWEELHQRPG